MSALQESVGRWDDHPIVAHVIGERGTDPLRVLEGLYDTLCVLDDRFPGMKMAEILGTQAKPAGERDKVRAGMLAAGVHPKDIDLVAPSQTELAVSGLSETALQRKYGIGESAAAEVVKLRKPPTSRERTMAAAVAGGASYGEVALSFGASKSGVKRAVDRCRVDDVVS